MENTNNIQGRCSTCKHWKRGVMFTAFETDKPANVGTCSKVENNLCYYSLTEDAHTLIKDGMMDGDNVFTHENFGCIHYEKDCTFASPKNLVE
jgi:hypothetical protein